MADDPKKDLQALDFTTIGGSGPDFRHPDGSSELQRNLVYGAAIDERQQLAPAERLAIVEGSGLRSVLNDRVWADVLTACGCFEAAAGIFQRLRHWRKLGDLAWV